MSGWPWMNNSTAEVSQSSVGGGDAEAGKNEVADKDDSRPLIGDLISEYRNLIDQVQLQLQTEELYEATKHDDLWILRFLLSHKKDVERALSAAKATLSYRKKYSLDENDIRGVPPQDNRSSDAVHDAAFQRFINHGVGKDGLNLVVPDTKRCGVVFYFNIADLDTHQLAKVDQEDWISGLSYVNEWQFQWNDYITRTTGRLTKSVHVVDVEGIYLSMYDYTTQDKYTTACNFLQDCYPQGVDAYLVCHAPFWIESPWKLLKPLLPVRVVTKLDFLNPKQYDEDRLRLLQYMPEDLLPERFGGQYSQWPPTSSSLS
jgi:hypothetical protein